MKKFIYLSLILSFFAACETDRESVQVKYQINNAYSPINVKYRNSEGLIINETINFESIEDIWQYPFEEKRGEIVYISARYSDSISSVKIMIIVDGKIYKQGSSINEPDKYVTVSGSIPY
jgi:hypothetical protein